MFYMKKLILALLSVVSVSAFAASNSSAPLLSNKLDVNKLECHCEKHKMIFELKDNEPVAEMNKHCLLNEDKKHDMVKFFDDNSQQTVKCEVKGGKLVLYSRQAFSHTNKAAYKKSSKMTASEYTTTSAH